MKFDPEFSETLEALDEFRFALDNFSHEELKSVFGKLRKIYDGGDGEVRYKIVFDLISCVGPGYNPHLVDFLIYVLENEKDDLVRHEAAFGLGELDAEEGREVLEKRMFDSGVLTRHECAISIASIANPKSLLALENSLEKETDQGVISSVRYAIRHIKFKKRRVDLEK